MPDASRTLSLRESATALPARADHLYLALTAGKAIGGARWALTSIDRIEVGRGATRMARRDGRTLRIDVPDPWMSSSHLRFVREHLHWVAVDAGSRNGILISGQKHDQAILNNQDVVEAGRSFFLLRTGERAAEPVLDLAAQESGTLATLDPALAGMFEDLTRIAVSEVPVLISGPTGAGKQRVARAIHDRSHRRGDLVPVSCGALPAGLVESELFGHKRGAFSGAVNDQPGLVMVSNGGTLFLDEIGDLPAPAQAAMLRVLEVHEVRAVGASAAVAVDLRVIAATDRDLDAMVEDGTFREDLVARLAGFELELPPLIDRRVDLGLMLTEIVQPTMQLAGVAARALLAYQWPRNIRELVRTIERAVALAHGSEVVLAHLPEEVAAARFIAHAPPPVDARRDELIVLLEKHHGNVSKIAVELGRVRQQVQRRLERYGLDPERYRT